MSSVETPARPDRGAELRSFVRQNGDRVVGVTVVLAVLIAFIVWLIPDWPAWESFKPYLVIGLAYGGVYALSGTGLVVLYRTTGVLNLGFGAVGAFSAFVAWQMITKHGWPQGWAFAFAVLVAVAITFVYGMVFGPPLAQREPLVKATATLGLTLIMFGITSWKWPGGETAYSQSLPTDSTTFQVIGTTVTLTQVLALGVGILVVLVTLAFLRFTKLGTAMRGLANDREVSAVLGVPVRRVEAVAWMWSGLLSGVSGIFLSGLVGLDAGTLTFLVISSLAAALIARLRSLVGTLLAGMLIGLVSALATPIYKITSYRDMTPFILATIGILVLSRRGGALSGKRIV